eukprot:CAMPEP_0182538198 /NCGR_PEP_ID=MMETSP1323-20130603/23328_1 /TAXON_ID=236787 /ORGANISM="Florenciella parvula, Strain RCC1693" /LENGTH=71 /DNA_ID=CAMNT_0024748651 /DNA_START=39 /DNA_END=254 /DNA_ORIENTATION=-
MVSIVAQTSRVKTARTIDLHLKDTTVKMRGRSKPLRSAHRARFRLRTKSPSEATKWIKAIRECQLPSPIVE